MKLCSNCAQTLEDDARFCGVCGAGLERPREALVDGRYLIEAELGRGGMGVVYRARDVNLARAVALKVMSAELARDPEVGESLKQEASALAAVRSDHVVHVYAFGQHEGSYFFVMELVAGRSVEDILFDHDSHKSDLPLGTKLSILRQVAAGLDAVHGAGLLHRDVKSGNVVIEERTGRAVLVDFGLALPAERGSTEWRIMGTPDYMAPEIVGGGTITARSDLYALACMAFEMLTGRMPFEAPNPARLMTEHLTASVPRASSFRPALALLDGVLARGLAKNPDDRQASCGAFAAALVAAAEPGQTERPPPPPAPRSDANDGSIRVLVVDDDPVFIKFAARAAALAFHGTRARIRTAPSGVQAIEEAKLSMPHLVLLDFDMPGLDGVATLARLRELPEGAQARIIVASASAGAADSWRFSAFGVQDFVRKPIELPALVRVIQTLAQRAGFRLGGPR
jgi:serine/threonine-protein kinase